jgi:hypothetical protein
MPTITELTQEAVALTDLAARLNDRTASWQEWNEELTCAERQEVAAEEAAIAATQAWQALERAEAEEAAYAEQAMREAAARGNAA